MAVACVDRKVTFSVMLSCLLHSQESAASIYSSSLKKSAIMGFRRGLQTLMTQCGELHRINCQQKLRSFVRQRIQNEHPREERPSHFRVNYLDHIKLFFLGFTNSENFSRTYPFLSVFAKMLPTNRQFNHIVTRSHPKTRNVTIKE